MATRTTNGGVPNEEEEERTNNGSGGGGDEATVSSGAVTVQMGNTSTKTNNNNKACIPPLIEEHHDHDDDDDDIDDHDKKATAANASFSGHVPDHHHHYTMVQRAAMRMARYPKTHFWVALIVSVALSVVGFWFGDFSVTADNAGWQSRGTLISNRHTQVLMITYNAAELFTNNSHWQELIHHVQPGWEVEGENYLEEETEEDVDDEEEKEKDSTTRRRFLVDRDSLMDALSLFPSTREKVVSVSRKAPTMANQAAFQKLLQRHLDTTFVLIDNGLNMTEELDTTTITENTPSDGSLNNTTTTPSEQIPTNAPQQDKTDAGVATSTGTETTSSSGAIPFLANCDTDWYMDGRMVNTTRLWPVWQVAGAPESSSALDPNVLEDLCESEQATQRYLEDHDLCFGCSDGKCLPPYSLVLFARLTLREVEDNMDAMTMECQELAKAFEKYQSALQLTFQECAAALKNEATATDIARGIFPDACPEGFYPSLVDEFMDTTENGRISYTSSIFATRGNEETVEELYDHVDNFDKGRGSIRGAYDTQYEDFVNLLADSAVGTDMSLATGSAFITSIAMLLHTRSPFLTMVGLIQIILSFPLAFFTYRFIGGLTFFPFLNFIGVFVVFALGADHVFVAVDKWKNARKDFPTLSTEEIAAKALPDSAEAMFLTTSTTAIAFFGTAICPVAPVKLFAIFCGLLIVFDYVMDIFLVFPCLCIYDGYRENPNCCITCHCCKMLEGGKEEINDDSSSSDVEGNDADTDSPNGDTTTDATGTANGTNHHHHHHQHHHHHHRYRDVDDDQKPSLIRRILLGYYHILHTIRWPLFVACAGAFAVCLYYALTLELPTTSDVRILREDHEFEKAYRWRLNLLNEALEKQGGSQAQVIWGVIPSDTGDHNTPDSWSQLVLDDTFDPSTTEAQTYMRDFCDKFFAEEFAETTIEGFECPINRFDDWLQDQAESPTDAIYITNCNEAMGLPMDPESFHACFSSWAGQEDEMKVLSRNGIVEVMYIPFASRVRYDSRNSELDDEWHLIEDWFNSIQSTAPAEVNQAYFSSFDFWWYDTNSRMFDTAMGAAAIAISASAAIIMFSSRSLIMTIFSVVSVGYVLASVTSMMVASGWTLGFLESICFAILIGISVDFVIHFSHAYAALPGIVSREKRTKHALIYMGPSILAAAVTTLSGAAIMMFCVITFFTKFAICLFFTIIQSTVGSFVVFLTLTDCIGPTQPTYMVDKIIARCTGKDSEAEDNGGRQSIQDESPGTAAKERIRTLGDMEVKEGPQAN